MGIVFSGGVTGKDFAFSDGSVTLGDGETFTIGRVTAPSGATLDVLSAGVTDGSGAAPAGLIVEVYNVTSGASIHSTNTMYEEGSPLSSTGVDGDDLVVRVSNTTGGTVDVSGSFLTGVFN